jgi:hypothetical protein
MPGSATPAHPHPSPTGTPATAPPLRVFAETLAALAQPADLPKDDEDDPDVCRYCGHEITWMGNGSYELADPAADPVGWLDQWYGAPPQQEPEPVIDPDTPRARRSCGCSA